MTEINQTYVSGQIAWLKIYPQDGKIVFTLRNPKGSFFVEYQSETVPAWGLHDWVLVEGLLYSRFLRGAEKTRIQATHVTILSSQT